MRCRTPCCCWSPGFVLRDVVHRHGGSATRIGPDFWPKIITGALAALCVYEIGKRLIIGTTRDAGGLTASLGRPPAAIDSEAIQSQAPVDNRKLVAGIAVIAGFVVGVAYLGFFIATALFVGLFCWIGGYRRTAPVRSPVCWVHSFC